MHLSLPKWLMLRYSPFDLCATLDEGEVYSYVLVSQCFIWTTNELMAVIKEGASRHTWLSSRCSTSWTNVVFLQQSPQLSCRTTFSLVVRQSFFLYVVTMKECTAVFCNWCVKIKQKKITAIKTFRQSQLLSLTNT